MILADENVHSHIIRYLREAGFEVISINEHAKGIKDEQVIQLAIKENYILLTEDKDFGEWVFAHHVKDLTVLFLRYSFHEFAEMPETIIHLLGIPALERPYFATITPKKIRIRNL